MKFGKNLLRITEMSDPAWAPFWLDYKTLKKLIKDIPKVPQEAKGIPVNAASEAASASSSIVASSAAESQSSSMESSTKGQSPMVLGRDPAEVNFFCLLHAGLQRAERFFKSIMEEYTLRVSRLHDGFEALDKTGVMCATDPWLKLARASFRVYKDLLLLELYAIMTFCAFSKILKKHDKATERTTRRAFMTSMVHGANFANTTALQQMSRGVEARYSEASEKLMHEGRRHLQEDERLFISIVAKMNMDVITVAGTEGAPAPSSQFLADRVVADGENRDMTESSSEEERDCPNTMATPAKSTE